MVQYKVPRLENLNTGVWIMKAKKHRTSVFCSSCGERTRKTYALNGIYKLCSTCYANMRPTMAERILLHSKNVQDVWFKIQPLKRSFLLGYDQSTSLELYFFPDKSWIEIAPIQRRKCVGIDEGAYKTRNWFPYECFTNIFTHKPLERQTS